MYMSIFLLFLNLLFITRCISGYDSRYNNRKHFVVKNKELAKILLPKSAAFQKGAKRLKTEFNKMTYAGVVFYICNLLLILSIPIFIFLIPKTEVSSYVIDSEFSISVNRFNEKLFAILTFLLIVIEFGYIVLNSFLDYKKQKKKVGTVGSLFLLILMLLFGLVQIWELISLFIEILI